MAKHYSEFFKRNHKEFVEKGVPGAEIGDQKSTKIRDERIDAVKFWLVVLVITGHVVMRKEFADSAACNILWNWIYIFHMPLFIFISGYFSRKKDKKDFWPSIWKLFEPLIVFHIIGLLFYVDSLSIKKFSLLGSYYGICLV